MRALQKVKNLTKSKEDKLLEKYGVIDDCGNLKGANDFTDAIAIVMEKAFKAHKAEIVKDFEEVEAEEKKNK